VTTRASLSNVQRTACTASSSSKWSPLFATMTGSTTRFGSSRDSTAAATASTIVELASMPVLTALQPMSDTTASICSVTKSSGTARTPFTPTVFCAVSAVMAEMP
jgi:hypothetical protein